MGYISINGAAELEKKFKEMGRKGATNYARTALRAGAKVILGAARSSAPEKSGLLKRSISIKMGKSTKDSVTVKVGPRRRWFKKNNAFYAGWVEFGHFLGRRIRKKQIGKHDNASYEAASRAAGRGFVPGQHYMEKAYSSSKSQAEAVAADAMMELVHKDVQD